MNYTVRWTDNASADLWELWSSPAQRSAVMAAAHLVDQLLEQNPFAEKYEVINACGTIISVPLGADFRIDVGRRTVFVTAVWLDSEEY